MVVVVGLVVGVGVGGGSRCFLFWGMGGLGAGL